MAKKEKPQKVEKEDKVFDPRDLLGAYLKETKDDHFCFEEKIDCQISTGSLLMDVAMEGGPRGGVYRLCGISGGGKTSFALSCMKDFLNKNIGRPHRAIYFKAEGRLSENVKKRSGVKFTDDITQWQDGECFVYSGNIADVITHQILMMMENNPSNTGYFFLIDSVTMLRAKVDQDKRIGEQGKVASVASVINDFLKQTGLYYTTYSHFLFLIDQVRAKPKINQYEKTAPTLTPDASGSNSATHSSDAILEFLNKRKDDLIIGKDGKTIGHNARVCFKKSDNEEDGTIVEYPIKHKQIGGNSVWNSREVAEAALAWGALQKRGAWINLNKELFEEVIKIKPEWPEQIQGLDNLYSLMEDPDNIDVFNFLDKRIRGLLLGT